MSAERLLALFLALVLSGTARAGLDIQHWTTPQGARARAKRGGLTASSLTPNNIRSNTGHLVPCPWSDQGGKPERVNAPPFP